MISYQVAILVVAQPRKVETKIQLVLRVMVTVKDWAMDKVRLTVVMNV
jgi:hypothetical protein